MSASRRRSRRSMLRRAAIAALLLGGLVPFFGLIPRLSASASTSYSLLIADNMNRRLLITDFNGNIEWVMNNPTGGTSQYDGPLGVRWMPNNQILATFGTGQVAQIDIATKKIVWQTSGYNGDWFQSPYDAELLPDGSLAVATRYNEGGRCTVYNRSTGAVLFKYLLSNAHVVRYEPSSVAYNSPSAPVILCGGWGQLAEVAYQPGGSLNQRVTWSVPTEYTHEALHVENGYLVKSEGYYINKIDRNDTQIWKVMTPDEERRVVVNPNGGYIFTVLLGDRVEFRGTDGHLISQWMKLSDGTTLNYPYGIDVGIFGSSTPTPTPAPTSTPTPSGTLFTDGFESGSFANWTKVATGGDGTATVQSSVVRTGSFAARLTETTNSGSLAYIRKTLSAGQTSLTTSADVDVSAEGLSGSNVPILRLFTGGGTRIVSLYRQNATGGQLWVSWAGTYHQTTASLPLGTWSRFQLKVVINGTASTVAVVKDGTTIFSTTAASLGSTAAQQVQIGCETASQGMGVYADNVSVTTP